MVVRLSDFLNTSFSTFSANDTNNTGITYPGAVVHNTTLTPGLGIGAGLDYQVETSNNNTETGMRLETVTTDVTPGSEDFDFVVRLMQNGATASEKFRVSSTGNVGIGTTSPAYKVHVYDAAASQLMLQSDGTTQLLIERSSTDTTAPALNFRKLRGTTASPSVVASGDEMGRSNYSAYDGATVKIGAQFQSFVETFTGVDNFSSYVRVTTRDTGAGAPLTERMRISGSGNVLINRTTSTVGLNTKLDINGAVNASAFLVNGVALTSGGGGDNKRANIAFARALTA